MTAMILGEAAAGAGQLRSHMIAGVRVEPLFQRPRCQAQRLAPRRHFSTASKSKSAIDWHLRVFRFPGRFRFEGRFGTPFFGLSGSRLGPFQLGIRPLFTSLPILLQLFPKLMPLLDLLPRELGLFRAQIPGVRFACHRPGQTVVRAVTRFGILLAGAACFTAFHGALGDRPPAHRFRLRENCG